jgi:dephospho-CoA kinase
MSFVLGLTGSIGMGKSTTAGMFVDEGIPVWDADTTVHRIYEPGQPGALAIGKAMPTALAPDGRVDRAALRHMIEADGSVLEQLNAMIHPLVAADRSRFLAKEHASDIVLLDVPLLYETGLDTACDAVAVVSAPSEVQRARVLSREGMTEDIYLAILARQVPDEDKRARADYIIPTISLEAARQAVKDVLTDIRRRIAKHA